MIADGWRRTPLLVLDLDGTVREGKDDALGRFVNGPEDVRVFPAAAHNMRKWKAGGGRIIGCSNQGGIALGLVSKGSVEAAILETHNQCGSLFDKIVYCQHHPNAKDPEFARCWCRKPAPGGLIEAALDLARLFHEMYPPYMALFVGDRDEDRQCAANINFPFQWAREWRGEVSQ